MASPTVTSSADTTASAERAAFADAWQQANQGEAEATALLYFGQNVPEGDTRYALWRFPLQEEASPQRIADVAWSPLGTPVGRLSPDEQWIAYIIGDQPTPGFELHLLRTDGSSDEVIAMIGIHSDCAPEFSWVGNEAHLVYRVGGGRFFRSYLPATNSERDVLDLPDGAYLLGGDRNERILLAVERGGNQSQNIVSVDLTTGAQTIIAAMPQPERKRLFCRKVSPNGSHLLFATGESPYQPYLFDSLTGQSRETDIVPNHAFWAQDSQHVLTVGNGTADTISVRAVPDMPVVARAVLPPVGNYGVPSGMRGVSPDGQWLLGCLITDAEHQSWLYHLPSQTWQQLTAGDADCVNVIGWPTR
jgi:hypothetical protein